ncbi:alpha/beta fold hydrolase [Nocardioides daphniae]|uniref:Epoxide hydrolase EphF n=1 Tax=Nocardioides daphniae TaxID=402297 RepID=A0ABQ1QK61_9ACTN|nr:alpha/beta hydrolase [Nocardioides daphniae]GGD28897.1 epoxide hydrolase EphF [Nocardioides daphniae]
MPSGAASPVPPMPEAPGFEHHVVETPGLRTHLATVGEGDPVLLLHGFPQHWWQWRVVASRLADEGYRALCPDLRGSGWTEATSPEITRTSRLDDVLALLDALALDRVHLVSHDLGSVTAIQLSYGHPERLRRAVQLSVPPAFMTLSPRTLPGFRHLPAFFWHRSGTSLRFTFSERYVAQPMSEADIAAHLAPMQRPEIDAAVRTVSRAMVLGEAPRLAGGTYRRQRLRVPTLFVFGREDRYWNEKIMGIVCREPEKYADGAEFAYVDGASHFITDDAPEAVADLVVDWLGRAA